MYTSEQHYGVYLFIFFIKAASTAKVISTALYCFSLANVKPIYNTYGDPEEEVYMKQPANRN